MLQQIFVEGLEFTREDNGDVTVRCAVPGSRLTPDQLAAIVGRMSARGGLDQTELEAKHDALIVLQIAPERELGAGEIAAALPRLNA